MRKRRYLAPWHQKGFDASGLGMEGEAAEEAMESLRGKPAIYHCLSRVVNREFVFRREEKEEFVRLMRFYEVFSQVNIRTFCVMSNHFHILLEVPAPPEDGGASWSDERLLKHLGLIYGSKELGKLRLELEHYRSQENDEAAEAFRTKYFVRMWDLSAYMKILKQCFTEWFNRRHKRRGVLWEGRFDNVLVEDGHAARRVASYIDLNPVRAGIVKDPKNYRWSGYGEAVAGGKAAREGLRLLLFEEGTTRMNAARAARELSTWREVVRRYRVVMFEDGEERMRDRTKKRAGIPGQRVKEILAKRGKLSEAELVWCRTRYFVDGLVIGSAGFVNQTFALSRGFFGKRRKKGAHRIRGVITDLRTMRDLRKDAIVY